MSNSRVFASVVYLILMFQPIIGRSLRQPLDARLLDVGDSSNDIPNVQIISPYNDGAYKVIRPKFSGTRHDPYGSGNIQVINPYQTEGGNSLGSGNIVQVIGPLESSSVLNSYQTGSSSSNVQVFNPYQFGSTPQNGNVQVLNPFQSGNTLQSGNVQVVNPYQSGSTNALDSGNIQFLNPYQAGSTNSLGTGNVQVIRPLQSGNLNLSNASKPIAINLGRAHKDQDGLPPVSKTSGFGLLQTDHEYVNSIPARARQQNLQYTAE